MSGRLIIAQITVLSVAFALDGRWLGAAGAVEGYRADLVNRQILRVCTDPANMPFSNDKSEGFDNKVAETGAAALTLGSRRPTSRQDA